VVNSTNNAADAVDFDDFARDKNISRDERYVSDKKHLLNEEILSNRHQF